MTQNTFTDFDDLPAPVALARPQTSVLGGAARFDPALAPLRQVQGGALYLDVKWRILWARHELGTRIGWESEILERTDQFCLVKVTVFVDGQKVSSAHGSETRNDFPTAFIEKAETKALGRALAYLGYGTDAAVLEEGDTLNNLADSPSYSAAAAQETTRGGGFVARPQTPVARVAVPAVSPQGGARTDLRDLIRGGAPQPENATPAVAPATANNAVTDKQLKAIFAIGRETLGLADTDIDARCAELFGCSPEQLTKGDASRFIDLLKQDAA